MANLYAVCFQNNTSAIEKEVAGLIMDGKVQARIDSHLKVGQCGFNYMQQIS